MSTVFFMSHALPLRPYGERLDPVAIGKRLQLLQKVTMSGGIRSQACARSLMISATVVTSCLVGVFVALCLFRLAFSATTVSALWEVVKLPLLPGPTAEKRGG
jgi:hypothetical protein